MALGDGITWDETEPTDATVAVNIDDYNRDLRKGIRGRLALEHEFPDSQSATSEAGRHRYVSFQNQATRPAPSIAGTQIGGIYVKTQGLFFVNTATQEVQIVNGTAVGDNKVLISATDTSAQYLDSKLDGASIILVNTTAGSEAIGVGVVLGTLDATKSDSTSYEATSDGFVVTYKEGSHTVIGFTDAANPPTTTAGKSRDEGEGGGGFTMVVKKGDYWKVTGTPDIIRWVPLGT